MALAHDTLNGFYVTQYNEPLSKTQIETAERRLKEKKQLLEDIKNEVRLLELDAYDTYVREVIYTYILPGIVDKARKWLEMLNNKEFKIDKRKKYEEKEHYGFLTHDLEKIFDKHGIVITSISQLGYGHSADIIEFDCKNCHFILTIPIVRNVSLKDYQRDGAYAFQIHLHVEEHKGIHDFIGVTYDENDLKDMMNKYFATKVPEALIPKEDL